MSLILEQLDQLIHGYEKALIENVRLSCELCRLKTENGQLRQRLEGLVDKPDVLAEHQQRFCAAEDCPELGGGIGDG
jgi:hypothetical protein